MTSWNPGGSPEPQYNQPNPPPAPQWGASGTATPPPPAYGQQPQAGAGGWGAPSQQPYAGYGGAPGGGAAVQAGPGSIASMANRFIARLIDGVIIGVPLMIVFFILAAVLFSGTSCATDAYGYRYCTASGAGIGAFFLFYFLALVGVLFYELYFIGSRGATIGKKVMGIRVQDSQTGANIGMGRAFIRYLVLGLTGSICFLGYISPFFDSSKRFQGWHDKAANDLVVTTK